MQPPTTIKTPTIGQNNLMDFLRAIANPPGTSGLMIESPSTSVTHEAHARLTIQSPPVPDMGGTTLGGGLGGSAGLAGGHDRDLLEVRAGR
ncbi:hypothetical protein Ssi03_67820 [Sphaerisporangium siamense]|nr:hypothetical protein Ssi03_67820 [Sphaerisporangium siamense]